MSRPLRTLTRCLVCGFTEIRTDTVIDRGVVLLAECPRCEHRWTASAPRGDTAWDVRVPGHRTRPDPLAA